jgi:gamma-polyglutamate synthase
MLLFSLGLLGYPHIEIASLNPTEEKPGRLNQFSCLSMSRNVSTPHRKGRQTLAGSMALLLIILAVLLLVQLLAGTVQVFSSQALLVLPRVSILSGSAGLGVAVTGFWALMILLGNREWRNHRRRLESIPIRVHVNGSRGKTGTSRLIGAALRSNGVKVVVKTTGKMPSTIDIHGKEWCLREFESEGFPEGNIREQMDAVAFAADQGAQALVVECMALFPEVQQVSEEKFIRATIGVITNIRHDHLDVMGPDLVSAAKTLSLMIPRNQVLVTCEELLLPVLREEAAKRGAAVVKADQNSVPDTLIDAFPYITFKDNVAIALKVSQLLGLDRDKSLQGMLQSTPDYGTVRVFRRQGVQGRYLVVLALGVNDIDSVSTVLEELLRRGKVNRGPMVGLFNSRDDRAERSAEFGRLMGGKFNFEHIIVTGEYVGAFVRNALKEGYPRERLTALEESEPEDVLERLDRVTPSEGVVMACGNMVTSFGYGLVQKLEEDEKKWSSQLLTVKS